MKIKKEEGMIVNKGHGGQRNVVVRGGGGGVSVENTHWLTSVWSGRWSSPSKLENSRVGWKSHRGIG